MILTLPNPHTNQRRILESSARFKTVMCGRRFGKSEISQIIILVKALRGQRVAYVTPTYLLASVFFEQLIKAIPANIAKVNKAELSIKLITGGTIRFFTGERLDNLRGQKFHLVVVDEAAFIPNLEDGWNNAIRPTLTDYKGSAIFLSTPRGKNFFYSLYMRGISGEADWESFKFSTYDNPYIDPDEVDDAKRQLPAAVFEQEYLANAMENASNPFGMEAIAACINGKIPASKPVAYGIDLAKSVDWTVIIGLDKGGNVCHFDRFQLPWAETKERIMKLPKSTPVCIDSTGVGDPICEELQTHFKHMEGVKFTSDSKQKLMTGLQSSIHRRAIGYPEGVISNELEIIEYQYTSTGVRYGAPSGFHDDCVMSLALAVKAKNEMSTKGSYSIQ